MNAKLTATTPETFLEPPASAIIDASQTKPGTSPWLPPELIEQIISEAWSAPQSMDERMSLFISMCQVNRIWLSIFIRIALRDVHISCPILAEDYLRLLRERVPSEPSHEYLLPDASAAANSLCRSLTFHVDHQSDPTGEEPSVLLYSSDDPSANAVSNTLYMVSTLNYLPNLRRVSIEYVNWGFDDIFEQGRLLAFPEQVTHLDVKFTFTTTTLETLAMNLRTQYSRRWRAGQDTLNVRNLCVSGAPITFVSEMIWACPNVETVHIDNAMDLPTLLRIPSNVRKLVLLMDHRGFGREEVAKLGLGEALGIWTMEHPKSEFHIEVDASALDPATWEETKKLCEAYKVKLTHCMALRSV